MVRVTAGISLLATAVLALLLFARMQSVTFLGKASHSGSGYLALGFPESRVDVYEFATAKAPPSFKSGIGYHERQILLNFSLSEEALREIPEDAVLRMTHRWVGSTRLKWAYGCTELQCEGRAYAVGRSRAEFLWVLGTITAAPLICWSIAALAFALLRRLR